MKLILFVVLLNALDVRAGLPKGSALDPVTLLDSQENPPRKTRQFFTPPSFSNFQSAAGSALNSAANAASQATKAVVDATGGAADVFTQGFDNFKDGLHKTYATAEEALFRKNIFEEHNKDVLSFNEDFNLGKIPFFTKLNEFADLLLDEFNSLLNGFNRLHQSIVKKGPKFTPSKGAVIPESIDWRERGAVTPIKHQGQCASCYAFSAAGALEGQLFRKTGQLPDLSPQNLIDCSSSHENSGCDGGFITNVYDYVKDKEGLEGESSYPYEGKNGTCKYSSERSVGSALGYKDVMENEKDLEAAVATIGPISAAIDASHKSFQIYGGGVYYEPECKSGTENVNHAILIVGYGVEPSEEKYWLIKNSYGTTWGIDGYLKLAKGKNNHCGIASAASYPVV